MAGTDTPRRQGRSKVGRQSSADTRANRRPHLACLRCQRRKIRCDGQLPACKNCQNASSECIDGRSTRLKNLPRAYIASLKERTQWLESIVRARCPDVDLNEGPVIEEQQLEDGLGDPMQNAEASYTTPVTSIDAVTSPDEPAISQNNGNTVATSNSSNRMRAILGGGNALSHEIGLVSLGTNQDPRYIGPSSGYFLARVMLTKPSEQQIKSNSHMHEAGFPSQLVEAVQGPLPLPAKDLAKQLCDAYFEAVHFQYPILHPPALMKMLDQAYQAEQCDPVVSFQVNMVLAIGATILASRLKARIPGESYCLAALQHFEDLNIENSLQGLQCLVLLLIFTIHSPDMRLNAWYLNYQCIAGLLDLGLQRDINTQSGVSLLEQEMRTRIFWVIFGLDRTISTMMGRPIGLRDEGCELRLPQVLDETSFSTFDSNSSMPEPHRPSSSMRYSVHLFRLAKLNSEIKYVANSIMRDTPKYAYPTVVNIQDWQWHMLHKLDQWAAEIPKPDDATPSYDSQHMVLLCRLRYHSIRQLLLRPSPALPRPTNPALVACHESACEAIHIFDDLYRKNMLVHSWVTFHSLVLGTLTMLYCIKASAEVAQRTRLDLLMGDLSAGLSILSATGEHWSGAKRCRDILDELGRSIIRWMQDPRSTSVNPSTAAAGGEIARDTTVDRGHDGATDVTLDNGLEPPLHDVPSFLDPNNIFDSTTGPFEDFLASDSFADFPETGEMGNMDAIMRELFQDFIPMNPQVT